MSYHPRMRKVIALFVVAVAAVACSSSSEGSEACEFVGSYSVTGTRTSGDCQISGSTPVLDTITADGSDYRLKFPGLVGNGCLLKQVGSACKLQGACEIEIGDALSPANNKATAQYAWTFTADGFTGTVAQVIPPAKGTPNGCQATIDTVGKRQ